MQWSDLRRLLVLLAMPALILAILLVRLRGPAPKPASAPPYEFSADRALASLRTLLGDQTPHPIASATHDAVRDRLVAQFRALGYDVTTQRRFACNADLICGNVENVIARTPGANGEALFLTAHYDSVPAGPGASDDGVGVATLLEVARATRGERTRNPLAFLVTDGEEAGLLGAEGFVADAAATKSAAAFINVENRGTSGPSFMFETSRNNRWLVPIIARSLKRPSATSLFNSIYDLLPNDTDVTIFKRAGKTAVNFGAIGNVGWYHTPSDDVAHVSRETLQHHGDNVLELARAMADAELHQGSDESSVFFDVLMLKIVQWPRSWSLVLALVALVLVIVAALRRVRAGAIRPRDVTFGVIAFFGAAIVAGVIGMLATKLALLRGSAVWIAHPQLLIVAMWLIGITSAIALATALRRAGFTGLWLGIAICWCAAAIATDRYLAGGAYLFLVPALAMAVLANTRVRDEVAAIVVATIAAALFFPLGIALYAALGTPILPGIAVILAIVATTIAPAMERTPWLLAAIALVCVVATIFRPTYSAEWPRRIPITLAIDGDAHSGEWQVATVAGAMRNAAPFGAVRVTRYPWSRRPASLFVAPAGHADVAAPEVTVVRDQRAAARTIALRIRSVRAANRVALSFRSNAPIDSIRINGIEPPPRPERWGSLAASQWRRVGVRGSEVEIEITVRGAAPLEVVATDVSYGIPASGSALARARDAADAVTSDDGDVTLVTRRLRF